MYNYNYNNNRKVITKITLPVCLLCVRSNTFVEIHASNLVVWKMQRYHLVREFTSKPSLVPPLVLLAHVFFVVRIFWNKYKFQHHDFTRFGFREYVAAGC